MGPEDPLREPVEPAEQGHEPAVCRRTSQPPPRSARAPRRCRPSAAHARRRPRARRSAGTTRPRPGGAWGLVRSPRPAARAACPRTGGGSGTSDARRRVGRRSRLARSSRSSVALARGPTVSASHSGAGHALQHRRLQQEPPDVGAPGGRAPRRPGSPHAAVVAGEARDEPGTSARPCSDRPASWSAAPSPRCGAPEASTSPAGQRQAHAPPRESAPPRR